MTARYKEGEPTVTVLQSAVQFAFNDPPYGEHTEVALNADAESTPS